MYGKNNILMLWRKPLTILLHYFFVTLDYIILIALAQQWTLMSVLYACVTKPRLPKSTLHSQMFASLPLHRQSQPRKHLLNIFFLISWIWSFHLKEPLHQPNFSGDMNKRKDIGLRGPCLSCRSRLWYTKSHLLLCGYLIYLHLK